MRDDSDNETFAPETEAKRILRVSRVGSLGTLNGSGDPFASLVTVATEPDGSPLLLLSQLSSHTRHLDADPRVSILLAETGPGDPLAHARLTVSGTAHKLRAPADQAARQRFLARHPHASLYAGFGDFAFWRIAMSQIHLNGGFARAARFPAGRIVTPIGEAGALLAAETDALAHMNANHIEALALYATVLAGQPTGDWRATGLDPEGLDLACDDRTARIAFPRSVGTPSALRAVLIDLAHVARAQQSGTP